MSTFVWIFKIRNDFSKVGDGKGFVNLLLIFATGSDMTKWFTSYLIRFSMDSISFFLSCMFITLSNMKSNRFAPNNQISKLHFFNPSLAVKYVNQNADALFV